VKGHYVYVIFHTFAELTSTMAATGTSNESGLPNGKQFSMEDWKALEFIILEGEGSKCKDVIRDKRRDTG
jgi:hypothetical protein